jgi:hopene-associated glycosyltransferase HpnB
VIATTFAAAALVIWLSLLGSGFWLCSDRDDRVVCADPVHWPEVVAVVPARNEADVIARSLVSLAGQDYPGTFRVVLVDDNSTDATGLIARDIASNRLTVLDGAQLAAGWTGKLWALSQGIAAAGAPRYLWLTDADIEHAPDTLRRLAAIAEAGDKRLVSFMARLHCETWPERALVPAFIYFFKMVYPFNWINRRGPMAGAAGGCVLVRRDALEAAGGIGAIRGALIDDCTLGALIKRQGPIWLGLTRRSRSIRPYRSAGEIAAMIARSAYAQLRYSKLLLVGTVLGLALVYGVAPVLAITAHGPARVLAIAACALMASSYQPVLRFYRRSPFWGLALPLVAAFYAGCTLLSARQHRQGKGGMWKGRTQAQVQAQTHAQAASGR